MDLEYIIVQAGGKGTRLERYTKNKPKALVPVNNRPMLFHLFEKYPQKKFIVVGDYKFDVLQKYLKTFAKIDYVLIDSNGKTGTCSGLKEAISIVPDGCPFMLIWCDLVLPGDFELPAVLDNYVGISKDFKCRWSYVNGEFVEEPSYEHGVAGFFIFKNSEHLAHLPESGEFVRWLKENSMAFSELSLYRTKEYGVLKEYEALVGGRCRPFNRLIIDGDTLIKEGIDEQGKLLAIREKAWYSAVINKGFSNIPHIYSIDPLKMERIDGKNVFEYQFSHEEKKTILLKMLECLKQVQSLGTVPSDIESFKQAYIGKTFERLEKIRDLVPFANDPIITVNNRKCRNIFFLRDDLERKILEFFPAEFKFIHGDCTFSNILLRNGKDPVIIDPRGYFGHIELYGDEAYDWAKLYYSVVGNYDRFNLRRFLLSINEHDVDLQIESNDWEDMEKEFFSLLSDTITPEQIKLIHAIIWLSLTTYAWEDYDSICGAFYNGLYHLEEVL